MRLKPTREQVIVVMGASSGIGRLSALRFAERGARVVVSARGEAGLRSVVDEIRDGGAEAISVTADAAEFDEVKAVANAAVEEYGRLDTWVHVAGVGLFATFERTTPEEFERVIDVNLMGQVYGAMAALPHIKREGRWREGWASTPTTRTIPSPRTPRTTSSSPPKAPTPSRALSATGSIRGACTRDCRRTRPRSGVP